MRERIIPKIISTPKPQNQSAERGGRSYSTACQVIGELLGGGLLSISIILTQVNYLFSARCFFMNDRPDPDLKYFSREKALCRLGVAI